MRIFGAVVGIVLALAAGPAGVPAAAGPPVEVAPQSLQGASLRVVTLITGDRVTVQLGEQPSVVRIEPAKGRNANSFTVSQANGHLRVLPKDAIPLLKADRIDARLFDVSTLLEFGYDDRRADLPLVVTGNTGLRAASSRTVPGGTALRVAKNELTDWWASASGATARATTPAKIWLDGLRKPVLDQSVPQIKAPEAWAAGYTGTGVKVGVVDSGIDANHPDLAGKVIAAQDFVGDGHNRDLSGHGTHVAATIASNDGKYKGVAPGAQLFAAKVCVPEGFCPESAMLEGMQWSAEQGAKIINMSLGGPDGPELDPVEAAVQDLTARYGVLFVIAAGNSGADESIGSPGSADAALTVGAVDRQDNLANFSSRGPRIGDAAIKPDITAPGVGIVAARSADSDLGEPGDTHVALSGTSMATPHMAGAAAILAQQHPDWSPAEIKSALMGSAVAHAGQGVYEQGAGRVDVSRAIRQQVTADAPSVSFGLQAWPHNDDQPVTRTVTYRNHGTADVALELSYSGVPDGLFTLSANTLTVPAGGTASVGFTADTRADVPDRRHGGYLIARAGDVSVSTPFAVDKESERYNVTATVLDRAGQPAEIASILLTDPTTGFVTFFSGGTLRVPKGHYVLSSTVYGTQDVTMLTEPNFAVESDRSITIDARVGQPIKISLPMPDAAPVFEVVSTIIDFGDGRGAFFGLATDGESLYAGTSDPASRSPYINAYVAGHYAAAGTDPADSPYVAQVAWQQPGRMYQGLTKSLGWNDLATVDAHNAGQGLPEGFLRFGPSWPDLPAWTNSLNPGGAIHLPSNRLEYHNTDGGVAWARLMFELDESGATGNVLYSPPTKFVAGKRYVEHRNRPVYGPGFTYPSPNPGLFELSRRGDRMTLVPGLTNDKLNWFGIPQAGEYHLTLDRNGQPLFEGPYLGIQTDVPPGAAQFRFLSEVTRGAPNTLSTKVSSAWTFRSGTEPGEASKPLPVSAVRFTPKLDDQNTAPAGRPMVLPIEVQRQPGSAAGKVRTLTVEVSYDDGVTWKAVPLVRLGQHAVAHFTHPAQAGFVSLRASSTDVHGNTLNHTIIRAYRIA